MVTIKGQEILIPTTMVGAYPRPHWFQGRVLGSINEPLWRSQAMRVAFEDATALCCLDQEQAGLDLLGDGSLFQESEADGYDREPLFHLHSEFLQGFSLWGRPNAYHKYAGFYIAECNSKIEWVRSYLEGPVQATKKATKKPVKLSFLAPTDAVTITKDNYYNDQAALAMDLAAAMNEEFRYLHGQYGLDALQIIGGAFHYIQEPWLAKAMNRCFEGLDDVFKVFHTCYGSVESQPDIWDKRAADAVNLLSELNVDALSHEMANRNFNELDAFGNKFPSDKLLVAGVVDDHNLIIETPEQVADGIRKVLDVFPAERLMVSPDCGLGYFTRSIARKKLQALVEGTNIVRAELS